LLLSSFLCSSCSEFIVDVDVDVDVDVEVDADERIHTFVSILMAISNKSILIVTRVGW